MRNTYMVRREFLRTGTRFSSYDANILDFDSRDDAYDYIRRQFDDNKLGKDILEEEEFNSETPMFEQTARLIHFSDGTIGLEIFTIIKLSNIN